MHINLLPRPILWRLLLRNRLRQWAVVWGAILAVGLTLGGVKYLDLAAKRSPLAEVERRCQPLREVESETNQLQQRLAVLTQQSAALQNLVPQQRALALVGIVARSGKRTAGKLQVQRLSFQAAAPTSPPIAGPSNPASTLPAGSGVAAVSGERSTLQLQGVAIDDGAVAQFVDELRQAQIFERVELKSCSELRTPQGNGRQYQVECRFE